MSKKLFVGGLSWSTTQESLLRAFESYGEITEAKVITDRDTGKSRGFGFVTFVADDVAEKAMAEMNGKDLDGRAIRVNEANEKPADGPRGGGGGFRGGPRGGGGGGGFRGGGGGGFRDGGF